METDTPMTNGEGTDSAVKRVESAVVKCPYPDCWKVHYWDCPIHGVNTHEHNTKRECRWQPQTKTGAQT